MHNNTAKYNIKNRWEKIEQEMRLVHKVPDHFVYLLMVNHKFALE